MMLDGWLLISEGYPLLDNRTRRRHEAMTDNAAICGLRKTRDIPLPLITLSP